MLLGPLGAGDITGVLEGLLGLERGLVGVVELLVVVEGFRAREEVLCLVELGAGEIGGLEPFGLGLLEARL